MKCPGFEISGLGELHAQDGKSTKDTTLGLRDPVPKNSRFKI
jgi:hypothetical protein